MSEAAEAWQIALKKIAAVRECCEPLAMDLQREQRRGSDYSGEAGSSEGTLEIFFCEVKRSGTDGY